MTSITLPYNPLPKQKLLHGTTARQVFFGGAAGPGKSTGMRWDAIDWCLRIPGLQAFLFRRTMPELKKSHIERARTELPSVLGKYNETDDIWRFYNGSVLHFCYCEKEHDVERYQSFEIHWLGVDEGSHFTEFQLAYLRGRVRLGDFSAKIPEQYKALLPRIVIGSNPGGVGHSTLKAWFIDPAPPMTIFHDSTMRDPKNPESKGWPTIFIPARMSDNPYLDNEYAGQFQALGVERARALTEGDWDAVPGAAWHNLTRERHQLPNFGPPRHWTRFMALDWGTARPFSVGWYAVAGEPHEVIWETQQRKFLLLPGAVVRYAEWYGWNGKANQGIRYSADQVALGILQREKDRGEEGLCSRRVGDSAMWAQHDGPSSRERMYITTDGRINLIQSRKDRKANYDEICARLAGNFEYGKTGEEMPEPMFFVTANCLAFWRTVPPLTSDENDPDKGWATEGEDHVADECAYALASRPYLTSIREYEDRGRPKRRAMDPYAT